MTGEMRARAQWRFEEQISISALSAFVHLRSSPTSPAGSHPVSSSLPGLKVETAFQYRTKMISEARKGEILETVFDEIPQSQHQGSLGVSEAAQDTWAAGDDAGSCSINVILNDFEWGTWQNRPACLIQVSIIAQAKPRIVKFAKIEILSKEEIIDGGNVKTSFVEAATWKPDGEYGNLSFTPVVDTRRLEPRVEAMGVSAEFGEVGTERQRQVPSRWSITGGPSVGRKGVNFALKEDDMLQDGIPHHIHASAIFWHSGKSFVLSFRTEGRTGHKGHDVSASLKRKFKELERRIFRPPTASNRPFMPEDLERSVAQSPHLTDAHAYRTDPRMPTQPSNN